MLLTPDDFVKMEKLLERMLDERVEVIIEHFDQKIAELSARLAEVEVKIDKIINQELVIRAKRV